jgi:hypothetical protein
MGPLGAYGDAELANRVGAAAAAYTRLDPAHPAVPALDLVDPVAQPFPGPDGTWVVRMDDPTVARYLAVADKAHGLLLMDLQVGHSSVQKEVGLLDRWLAHPEVGLSLDPEFAMAPGTVPGRQFGTMSAADINWAIDHLASIVRTEGLPPKLLVVHRFIDSMLPDPSALRIRPEVELVLCEDGVGPPGPKIDGYVRFAVGVPGSFPGMKVFTDIDRPLMSEADLLRLSPPPLLVMIQ